MFQCFHYNHIKNHIQIYYLILENEKLYNSFLINHNTINQNQINSSMINIIDYNSDSSDLASDISYDLHNEIY